MDSFLENLRMGSIFNPYAGQNLIREDPINTFNTRILPLVHQEKEFDDQRKLKFMNILRAQQEAEANKTTSQPKNTIFNPMISPLDQAKLNLQKEKVEQTGELGRRRLGYQEEKQDTDSAIRQQRANTYEFKARNPNLKFQMNRVTGELNAIDPITGEIKQGFGKMQMGQEELIDLNQDNKIKQIETTGSEARKTEQTRQAGRESLEDIKARHARELAEFNSTMPPKTAGLPTQQSKAVENRYNVLINKRPDLRRYVELDPNTRSPIISPVGTHGLTQEDYDYINNSLFPASAKGDTRLPNETTPKPGEAKPSGTSKPGTTRPKILSMTPITPSGGK